MSSLAGVAEALRAKSDCRPPKPMVTAAADCMNARRVGWTAVLGVASMGSACVVITEMYDPFGKSAVSDSGDYGDLTPISRSRTGRPVAWPGQPERREAG